MSPLCLLLGPGAEAEQAWFQNKQYHDNNCIKIPLKHETGIRHTCTCQLESETTVRYKDLMEAERTGDTLAIKLATDKWEVLRKIWNGKSGMAACRSVTEIIEKRDSLKKRKEKRDMRKGIHNNVNSEFQSEDINICPDATLDEILKFIEGGPADTIEKKKKSSPSQERELASARDVRIGEMQAPVDGTMMPPSFSVQSPPLDPLTPQIVDVETNQLKAGAEMLEKTEKKVEENVDKSSVQTGGAILQSISAGTGLPAPHPVKKLEATLSHLNLNQPNPVLQERTPNLDAEQEVINISITEKEAQLEELRKHTENLIESKAKEMSKLIAGAEAAEDEKFKIMKETADIDVRIKELQTNKARLIKEVEEKESTINKLNTKRKKLEHFIATNISETKTNMEKLEGEIDVLKSRVTKHTQECPTPTVEPPKPRNLQLLEFINNKIEAKEKELECPVCLDVASVPIYMCDELHLICGDCRPKVSDCPECREPYPGRPRRHRYAERAAEELAGLKAERAAILGESAA